MLRTWPSFDNTRGRAAPRGRGRGRVASRLKAMAFGRKVPAEYHARADGIQALLKEVTMGCGTAGAESVSCSDSKSEGEKTTGGGKRLATWAWAGTTSREPVTVSLEVAAQSGGCFMQLIDCPQSSCRSRRGHRARPDQRAGISGRGLAAAQTEGRARLARSPA